MKSAISYELPRLLRRQWKLGAVGAVRNAFDKALGKESIRTVSLNGLRIEIRTNTPDLRVAMSGLCDLEYDPIELMDPRIIVDAGANIGTSSLFFALKYPEARIFAVEPEAGNFALLKKNTRNYANIVPIRAAIWGEDCTRALQNRFTGTWGYTVSETLRKSEPVGQTVDCLTIPSLMKQHDIESIDLLKMDIEGGEKDVLENSEPWIDSVGTISAELHEKICTGCERAFYRATKEFKRYEKHGEKITAYRVEKALRPGR